MTIRTFGPTMPLPETSVRTANKEPADSSESNQRSWGDSSTRSLFQFASQTSRALGVKFETVLNKIDDFDPGARLKQQMLDSANEVELLKKIGLDHLTLNPRGAVMKKWQEELEKQKARGMSAADAWTTLQSTQPELYEAYCYVANTQA